MRGYPKGPLTKVDYENLLSMPEHAERAKAELEKLASVDDIKVSKEVGTVEAPKQILVDNPMPLVKRIGFEDKDEIIEMTEGCIEKEKLDDADVLQSQDGGV